MTIVRKSIGMLLCSALFVSLASAATLDEVLRSYQQVATIAFTDEFTVPTVVEVPIQISGWKQSFEVAVYDETAGKFVPSTMVTKTDVPIITQHAYVEGRPVASLTDRKIDTAYDFPVALDTTSVSEFMIRTYIPITVSALSLGLATHVAMPQRISITVGSDEQVVVSNQAVRGSIIYFPEVTGTEFTVRITHTQPLRLTEVSLVQSSVLRMESQYVRFLAQPGSQYKLYADADRWVRPTVGELPSLNAVPDAEVVRGHLAQVLQNPAYEPADTDGDDVPDLYDNCISVANTDQTDVDGNGRGDVCDDFDRDGRINSEDNCVNEPNRSQVDTDGDGIGDVCDSEESRFTERYAFVPWVGIAIAFMAIMALFVLVKRHPVEPEEHPTV